MKKIKISQLMAQSGVKFGTSGVRGLVKQMTDETCYLYTLAFIKYLLQIGDAFPGTKVAIAYDLRESSPRIVAACIKAIEDSCLTVINAGAIPTPALAYYSIQHNIPSMMVTGSHIPDDRNGIKFYTSQGEILKHDEEAIKEIEIEYTKTDFNTNREVTKQELPKTDPTIQDRYSERYLKFFPKNALSGIKIGIYQHSSVAASAILTVLNSLGANTMVLGESEIFVPVDTEAVRDEDKSRAEFWCKEYQLDGIVSTDGDGDRPLIFDEKGKHIPGDIIGVLTATYLGADVVVTPVTSNTSVELCHKFKKVIRTKVGSPYVIEKMKEAENTLKGMNIIGYEANGGFLTLQPIEANSKKLDPLMTRDSLLPILCLLHRKTIKNCSLSQLAKEETKSYKSSCLVTGTNNKNIYQALENLYKGDTTTLREAYHKITSKTLGDIRKIDTADGARMYFTDNKIIHIRNSGNAPEARCYVEAKTEEEANKLSNACYKIMNMWKQENTDK